MSWKSHHTEKFPPQTFVRRLTFFLDLNDLGLVLLLVPLLRRISFEDTFPQARLLFQFHTEHRALFDKGGGGWFCVCNGGYAPAYYGGYSEAYYNDHAPDITATATGELFVQHSPTMLVPDIMAVGITGGIVIGNSD